MITLDQPWWLRVSEWAFAFNFISFSFVMFSCLFPTGFSATFSSLAFIFALPLFFDQLRSARLNTFEIVGLVLFGWLAVSLLWSDRQLLKSVGYLFEYRIYFILPVFILALRGRQQLQFYSILAALTGATVALFASYFLALGWIQLEGAHLSLADHIYHGFIMASLLMICLVIFRDAARLDLRIAAIIVASLALFNTLGVEQGRTGYLQVGFVFATFTLLSCSKVRAAAVLLAGVVLLLLVYVTSDQLQLRVDTTLNNFKELLADDSYTSSIALRLEYYRGAIDIGLDFPLFGVGVGDVEYILAQRALSGEIMVLTDNVHNEFLNMLIAGGVPAMILFSGFAGALIYCGFVARSRARATGDMLIALGVILVVSALFNSTIKDYGEKHALMIMLSILGARLSELEGSQRTLFLRRA